MSGVGHGAVHVVEHNKGECGSILPYTMKNLFFLNNLTSNEWPRHGYYVRSWPCDGAVGINPSRSRKTPFLSCMQKPTSWRPKPLFVSEKCLCHGESRTELFFSSPPLPPPTSVTSNAACPLPAICFMRQWASCPFCSSFAWASTGRLWAFWGSYHPCHPWSWRCP